MYALIVFQIVKYVTIQINASYVNGDMH